MAERLSAEREAELRDYLRKIHDPGYGFDGYPTPQDRDRSVLLAELDVTREELKRVEEERDALEVLAEGSDDVRVRDQLVYRKENGSGMVGWVANGWVYMKPLAAIRAALAKGGGENT